MADQMQDMGGPDVGSEQALTEPVKKYDAKQGTYQEAIATVPTESRLPTTQMPKATDPSPFTLGPMTSGG